MGKMLNKNRVLVAMSGGVDSSVAISKILDQGYEAIGITLKLWENIDPITKSKKNSLCNSTEAINRAKMVCDRLGIHHYTLNYIDSFKTNVIEDFVSQYMKGRTPNPCVKCNSQVKWESLIEQANKLNAYYVSTGHYAGIKDHKIVRGKDICKDQSYMLWHLNREHIERTILPIGSMTKTEVRKYANDKGLETSNIPDSQDLCFVMDGDYRDFLNEHMPEKMKNINNGNIENEEGEKIGFHSGFTNYTIGQRKGLKLSYPEPRYVKKINPITNTVTVAKKESILLDKCKTKKINWLIKKPMLPINIYAKVRYNGKGCEATITQSNEDYIISFQSPQLAITPGQSVVFYDKDILVGGGIIE